MDGDAYCQVEMAIWQGRVFLTGGLCTRTPLDMTPQQCVRETADRIGYPQGHPDHHDALQVESHICLEVGDPARWSRFANEQCIGMGYAGYDAKVAHLPPEHWLGLSLETTVLRRWVPGQRIEHEQAQMAVAGLGDRLR